MLGLMALGTGLGIFGTVSNYVDNKEKIRRAKDQYYHDYEQEHKILIDEQWEKFKQLDRVENRAQEKLYNVLATQGISTSEGIGSTYRDLISRESGLAFENIQNLTAEREKEIKQNLNRFNENLDAKSSTLNKNFIGNVFAGTLNIAKSLVQNDVYNDLIKYYGKKSKKARELQALMILGNMNMFSSYLGNSDNSDYDLEDHFTQNLGRR